jgi:Uma2 family endonuclease
MSLPAPRPATYQDVIDAPEHLVAELLEGQLYTHPRPAHPHATAASVLGMDLGSPFHRGRGGPGGWWILDEPELHLGANVLVPDLAGWRRTRMPTPPSTAFYALAPDWACEVLSPSTLRVDRVLKLPIYAREGVPHVWLVDPIAQTLEVFGLDGTGYRLLSTHGGDARVRAEPFAEVELELGAVFGLPEAAGG